MNRYTDNAAIGPELKGQSITTNQTLWQTRAETVMQCVVSQGVELSLVAAQGFGDALNNIGCLAAYYDSAGRRRP